MTYLDRLAQRLDAAGIACERDDHDGSFVNVGDQSGWVTGEVPMATFCDTGEVMTRATGDWYPLDHPVIRAIVIAADEWAREQQP